MAAAAWRILLFAARVGRPRLQQWLQWLRMKYMYKNITEELWYVNGADRMKNSRSAVMYWSAVCIATRISARSVHVFREHWRPVLLFRPYFNN